MSERRITFIIGSMREGGAEKQVVYLMRGLRDRGWTVRLMLLHYEGMRLQPLLEEGFEVFAVNLPRFRPRWNPLPWLQFPFTLLRSVRWLRETQPQIVYAWLFWAHLWAWLCRRYVPFTLITSRRQMFSDRMNSPRLQRIENRINRDAALIIANAEAVAETCLDNEENVEGSLRVIRNGIDFTEIDAVRPANLVEEFPALADASEVVVNVANLLPHKGHSDLLKAWAKVIDQHPDARLLCIGADGGLGSALNDQARRLGIAKHVVFAGPREDVISLVKGADFAVHASHDEGFPNAVMEYLACGKYVVATDAGGTREAVDKLGLGIIVPARKSKELAEALIGVLSMEKIPAAELDRKRYALERLVTETEVILGKLIPN